MPTAALAVTAARKNFRRSDEFRIVVPFSNCLGDDFIDGFAMVDVKSFAAWDFKFAGVEAELL